jgi:tetratricopeptide (TPR) repeat protein
MKKNSRSFLTTTSAVVLLLLIGSVAWSNDLLEDAGHAFDRADYKHAIELFKKARATDADCKIPFYLGLSHYRLRQLGESIVDLASAVSCNPQSVEFNTALAEAYVEWGDDDLALNTFQTLLKLDPDNVGALRSASILYLRHNMSDEVIPVLEKLVALDRNDARASADLAAAYAAHGRFAEAENLFEKSLSINPQNVSALVGLGNLDFKNERPKPAIDVLTRAIQLDPHAYEAYVLRGRAYSRLGQYPAAITDLRAALKINAKDPEIHYYLSQTYRSMGRSADSQRELAEFKRLRDQSNASVESQREAARLTLEARRLVDSGDLAGAIALLEQARKNDPKSAPVRFRLAGLYFEKLDYDKAQASIQDAIDLAPAQWDYHFLQGLIHVGLGHLIAAQQSLETAVRLNPSAAEAHNQLGDLAVRRNDFKRAMQEFARAVELAPSETSYRANLDNATRLAR